MILTMVYKTGEIRSLESVTEVHSRKRVSDDEFELVISVFTLDDTVKVPLLDLDRWDLRTGYGAVVMNIELRGPADVAG